MPSAEVSNCQDACVESLDGSKKEMQSEALSLLASGQAHARSAKAPQIWTHYVP